MKLPSNRKFGFFFGLILLSISIILHFQNFYFYSLIIFAISCVLFILSFLAPEILSGPNKIWMKFGLMLGKIFNPIIIGIIFFGIFTPLSFFFKLIRRDELKINFSKKNSYWIPREKTEDTNTNFEKQY